MHRHHHIELKIKMQNRKKTHRMQTQCLYNMHTYINELTRKRIEEINDFLSAQLFA